MKTIQDKVNVVAPGGDFTSFGTIKDNTGSNDGTPADTDLLSDQAQFFDKMISESSVTPNNALDNDANGFQLYEAFRKLTKPYMVYTATLTQSGTGAPVETVLGENEIGAIVWTRNGTGAYIGTLSSAFTAAKTWVIANSVDSTTQSVSIEAVSTSVIDVRSFNSGGSLSDDVLSVTSIEIRVYD